MRYLRYWPIPIKCNLTGLTGCPRVHVTPATPLSEESNNDYLGFFRQLNSQITGKIILA